MHPVLSVERLPSLCLIKIDRENLDGWAVTLLKMALYERADFFSFTNCEDEVSLILDKSAASRLPAHIQVGAMQEWSAMRVVEGAAAVDMSGVISEVTAPLSSRQINVFYLSTFHTDLILVSEDQFEDAFTHISSQIHSLNTTGRVARPVVRSSVPTSEGSESGEPGEMWLMSLPVDLRVVHLPPSELPSCTHSIVELMLLPHSEVGFFSITITSQEVSLIVEASAMHKVPEAIAANASPTTWRPLKLCPGASPFEDSAALVVPVSASLARADVPLFYLSTFSVDYTLVPTDRVTLAVETLSRTFRIETSIETGQ